MMPEKLLKFCDMYNFEITMDQKSFDHIIECVFYHIPTRISIAYHITDITDKSIDWLIEKIQNAFCLPHKDVSLLYPQNTTFSLIPSIKKVIFNDPATIVIWTDGTKTIVKAENEQFDPEKGLAMVIAKKALGNQGNYYNVFTEWLPKEGEPDEESDSEPYAMEYAEMIAVARRFTEAYKVTDGVPHLTPTQLAALIGQTPETVRKQCRQGLHPGAKKVNGKWLIPYEGKK